MNYVVALAAVVAVSVTGARAAHHEKKPDYAAMAAKMDAHFKEVDSNADGQISEQELVDFVTAKAKREFAAMAGDDGLVSYDEMKAHHQGKHEAMMKKPANGAVDEKPDAGEHSEGHH